MSTGFPELSPEISPICTTFPNLFPKQIDENSDPDPTCGLGIGRNKYRLAEDNLEEIND